MNLFEAFEAAALLFLNAVMDAHNSNSFSISGFFKFSGALNVHSNVKQVTNILSYILANKLNRTRLLANNNNNSSISSNNNK